MQTLFLMNIRGTSLVVKFILTLYIARFLDFEALGIYGLITAASIIIPSFLGLSLMYIQARHAVTQSLHKIIEGLHYYGRYLFYIYSILLCFTVIGGAVTETQFLALLLFLFIFLEHLNQDFYGLLLNLSKPMAANVLHFLRAASWAIIYMIVAFFYPAFRNIESLLIGGVIGSFSALIGFFWVTRNWPWLSPKNIQSISFKKWIFLNFKEARLIYLNNIITTFSSYLNHFLITAFLNIELTGIYVFFSQAISAMLNLIRTGIIQISKPKLVRAYKEQPEQYNSFLHSCFKQTLLTSILFALFACPFMYIIVHYFLNRPLAEEWLPLFWLMCITMIIASSREVANLAFYSRYMDNLIVKYNLFGLSGQVLFSLVLLPTIGLWGAPIASIIIGALTLILIYREIANMIKLKKAPT